MGGVTALDDVFAQLRAIMLHAAPDMVVTCDAPGDLQLRTPGIDPKTGAPGWFGTVKIGSYVAYHLIPLYADPALADGMSEALTKRRQGKTCFNFRKADPVLFAELEALTARAASQSLLVRPSPPRS